MKTIKEDFYFIGNYILELQNEYILGTVKAWYLEPDPKGAGKYLRKKHPVEISEIGGKFINLSEEAQFPEKAKIQVEYNISTGVSRLETNERLNQLEAKLDAQQKVIETMLEALKYRVDIQTFNTYLKALEEHIGVELFTHVFTKPYPGGGNTRVF